MYRVKRLEFWLVVVVAVLFAGSFSNAAVPAKARNMLANSLTAQIKNDLADTNVNVEIERIEEMALTRDRQKLFGEAQMVRKLKGQEMPIYFEAVFNTKTKRLSVVDYTFVEGEQEINTDFLQALLIKQIGNDHRTQEVAAVVDEIELVEKIGANRKFRGYGEVRIGSLVWSKIKFEIKLDNDSERVLYKLYKM